MREDIPASRRDLVARVATLELLISDLIDLLWRVDPAAMEQLAREANHDLEIQNSRTVLAAGEHQRCKHKNILAPFARPEQRQGSGQR